jgi:hypothetical protein
MRRSVEGGWKRAAMYLDGHLSYSPARFGKRVMKKGHEMILVPRQYPTSFLEGLEAAMPPGYST